MADRRLELVPDAFVRTYVGDEGWGWIVVRRRGGGRVRLDLTDRVLVDLADGSRAPQKHRRDAEEQLARPLLVREFEERVAALVEAGVLRDGVDGFADLDPTWPPNLVQARLPAGMVPELMVAPSVRVGCDGRGGCCRLYDRVDVTIPDLVRIRAAWPEGEVTPGGLTVDSALRPVRGEPDTFSLAARAGACVMLDESGRCAVHTRLGAAGKPAGCVTFPLRDVLVGGELHVGIAVECRCALDFARSGEPLALSAAALHARRVATRAVETLAPEVALTTRRRSPPARYLGWRESAVRRFAAAPDAVAFALDEAALLAGEQSAPPALLGALTPTVARLAELLDGEARDTARNYAASDLQRPAFAWAATAAQRLLEHARHGDHPEPPADSEGERLVVDQALFTHSLLRARALSTGLVALALRLALARAGAALPLPRELLPLSTAEYLFRAHAAAELCDLAGPAIDDALAGA